MVRFVIGIFLLVLWIMGSIGQIIAVVAGRLPPDATRGDLVPDLLMNQVFYLIIIVVPAILLLYFGRRAIKRKKEARQQP